MKDHDAMIDTWQKIYDLSYGMLTAPDSVVWDHLRHTDTDADGKASWYGIRDLRTIYMGGGRQNLKSAWVGKFLKDNPHAICIAIDKNMRDVLIHNSGGMDSFFHRVFTITDLVTLINGEKDWVNDVLGKASHLIFDNGMYNREMNTTKFSNLMSGIFDKDITVVVMG